MLLLNDIELLDESFKVKVKALINKLDIKKIEYIIFETKRLLETQQAYYDQGRSELIMVNFMRAKLGLYMLTEKENNHTITDTLQSKHLEGLAIDIVPSKYGKLFWTAPDSKWKEIADVAVECGLKAGYYWRKEDSPHMESL